VHIRDCDALTATIVPRMEDSRRDIVVGGTAAAIVAMPPRSAASAAARTMGAVSADG
jgi:hypothetical protein